MSLLDFARFFPCSLSLVPLTWLDRFQLGLCRRLVDETSESLLKVDIPLCLDALAGLRVRCQRAILRVDCAVADARLGYDFADSLFHLQHGPELGRSDHCNPYSKS